MAEYSKERDHVVTGLGTHGRLARIYGWLGLVFAVLGVIAAVANIPLGLGATNWLLLAVATCAGGIILAVFWAVGMYFHSIEAKSKK